MRTGKTEGTQWRERLGNGCEDDKKNILVKYCNRPWFTGFVEGVAVLSGSWLAAPALAALQGTAQLLAGL